MEQDKVLDVRNLHAVFRIDRKEYEVLHVWNYNYSLEFILS